jgi:hypothetical protein
MTMLGPDLEVVGRLASEFADAHAEPYTLVHGHLRWAAHEALELVGIPEEADLADLDQARGIGWTATHGRLP